MPSDRERNLFHECESLKGRTKTLERYLSEVRTRLDSLAPTFKYYEDMLNDLDGEANAILSILGVKSPPNTIGLKLSVIFEEVSEIIRGRDDD